MKRIEFYKELTGNDLNLQIGYIQSLVRNRYAVEKENMKPFTVVIDTGKKTNPQLRAFYEAITQLMPQYNDRQLMQGEKEFLNDEFKFILKYVGGWYKEIKNKKGDIVPIEKSFKNIKKDEMLIILDNINRWAIKEGYDLCIDEKLRNLIK